MSEELAGKQGQIDMGQMLMKEMYGKSARIYIFAMVMSHLCIFHEYNTQEYIKAQDMAFRYYGGRPEEIVYDQDGVMMVAVIFTEKFENEATQGDNGRRHTATAASHKRGERNI